MVEEDGQLALPFEPRGALLAEGPTEVVEALLPADALPQAPAPAPPGPRYCACGCKTVLTHHLAKWAHGHRIRPRPPVLNPVAPVGIQIEWLGPRRPKVVDLPIKMESRAERTGTVVCDPVGTFPLAEGQRLLDLVGDTGQYRFHAFLYPDGRTSRDEAVFTDHLGRAAYPTFAAAKAAMHHQRLTHVRPERLWSGFWALAPTPPAPLTDPASSLADAPPADAPIQQEVV